MKGFYIRDGRSPVPNSENTSKAMSSNKAKGTKPEISLRKALWKEGIRGYRLNWSKVPGRPDIAFHTKKLAIFINGCFWHRCPFCKPSFPKSHKGFWQQKFENNVRRDQLKIILLEQAGWEVLTLWECQLKNDMTQSMMKIKTLLSFRKK